MRLSMPRRQPEKVAVYPLDQGDTMNPVTAKQQQGKAGWILLWLIGVPVPVLLLLFLLRGCT